jgi:acyl-homoserine-lactone acylase
LACALRQTKKTWRIVSPFGNRRGLTVTRRLACLGLAFIFFIGPAVSLRANSAAITPPKRHSVEIFWDTWGVPHIYATTTQNDAFWGLGWAQMRLHPNLLLKLYGEARGRAAEYWGPTYLQSDRVAAIMGFGESSRRWYAMQTPSFKGHIDWFVAGMNAYASAHKSVIDPSNRVVLPVHATDVMARVEQILYRFSNNGRRCAAPVNVGSGAGSNAWAISPSDTVDGHAILSGSLHLPWNDDQVRLTDAQLTAPHLNVYGATFVGLPVFIAGFNNLVAWTISSEVIDTCDLYKLRPVGDETSYLPGDETYLFDGQKKRFEIRTARLKVLSPDGTFREEDFTLRRSVHGPVIIAFQSAFAIRMTSVDQFPAVGVLDEFWAFATASGIGEFQRALAALQISPFNVTYADRQGHIMYAFSGSVPMHPVGDFAYWEHAEAPGDTSSNLWTSAYPVDRLPRLVDPPSGWVQNSNSPPWFATLPAVLDSNKYPSDMTADWLGFREQRSVEMLASQGLLTFEQVTKDKFSTESHLADLVLPDLIKAAMNSGDDRARSAADVLLHWDRHFEENSRGAILFASWVKHMKFLYPESSAGFARPFDRDFPLTTPSGIQDPGAAVQNLREAASEVQSEFGTADVPPGLAYRLRYGKYNFPGFGGSGDPVGTFEALDYEKSADGVYEPVSGEAMSFAVEFSNPLVARALLVYGNSSEPTSPHFGDQIPLLARRELRPVWFSLSEVKRHLESYERLFP